MKPTNITTNWKGKETKPKSGFFDLPKEEICTDPEHNPPAHLFIPKGKGYSHICPKCGKVTILKNNYE